MGLFLYGCLLHHMGCSEGVHFELKTTCTDSKVFVKVKPQRETRHSLPKFQILFTWGRLHNPLPYSLSHICLSLSLSLFSVSPSSSPPPLPFGIQTQGFIIPGPGCPPFSPPPPPLLGPFPFIPPQFNPGFGYGPPFFHCPMNISQFPPQGMPPLVPYNVAN